MVTNNTWGGGIVKASSRSYKNGWAGSISFSALRATCALILICAAAALGLGGENTADKRAQAPPTSPDQARRTACEINVVSPEGPPSSKPPSNIEDGTRAALACEWKDPKAVKDVLQALKLLTSSSQGPENVAVLKALLAGNPDPSDNGFYIAAMGVPAPDGQPTVQGLPDFLDTLAKANTLKKQKPKDEDGLFSDTQKLIDAIFNTGLGKIALVKIHDSFSRKDNYVALYQLLDAYPGWDGNGSDADKQNYANDLEKFRAAFEMNTDRLASQVSAKISAAKKS